jgi:hypothetical protein
LTTHCRSALLEFVAGKKVTRIRQQHRLLGVRESRATVQRLLSARHNEVPSLAVQHQETRHAARHVEVGAASGTWRNAHEYQSNVAVSKRYALRGELSPPRREAHSATESSAERSKNMTTTSEGEEAVEQSAFHLHLHLVPRWHRDGFGELWPRDPPL